MPTPREIQAGVPQVSVLSPTLSSIYVNDAPQSTGVYLVLFVDDIGIYTTDQKKGYVLKKLQHGLTLVGSWCEHWNIKLNEDITQAIYFSRGRRPLSRDLY
jgi:hypothetical protein